MDCRPPVASIVLDEVTYWFSIEGQPDKWVTLPRLQAERRDYPFPEARNTLIYLLTHYGLTETAVAALLQRTQGTISQQRKTFLHFLAYDFESQRDIQVLTQRIGERLERWRQDAAAAADQRPRRAGTGTQGRHTGTRTATRLER